MPLFHCANANSSFPSHYQKSSSESSIRIRSYCFLLRYKYPSPPAKSLHHFPFFQMELYLLRSAEYQRLYNCSSYSVDDVPLPRRTHVALGVSFIMQFVLFEICYLPCLFSIWRHLSQACYKFMFFIGVIDVLCLFICCFMHGYFAITGTVFCTHPDLIYWAGTIGFCKNGQTFSLPPYPPATV